MADDEPPALYQRVQAEGTVFFDRLPGTTSGEWSFVLSNRISGQKVIWGDRLSWKLGFNDEVEGDALLYDEDDHDSDIVAVDSLLTAPVFQKSHIAGVVEYGLCLTTGQPIQSLKNLQRLRSVINATLQLDTFHNVPVPVAKGWFQLFWGTLNPYMHLLASSSIMANHTCG